MKPYATLREQAVVETVIKHSRFIATAFGASTYDEGIAKVAEIKGKYPDATHNCYAFVIEGTQQKYSDDGEPQGTAGTPILEVLRRKGLSYVGVVVTRYFGGIKLGTGGLVQAYTQATVAAIEQAGRVEMIPSCLYRLSMDYYVGGKLPYIVGKAAGKVLESDYEGGLNATVAIPEERAKQFEADFVELTKGKGEIKPLGLEYVRYS